MGACACGETDPDYQFPGPDGVIYAIQIYRSCSYCKTPVGVEVYRFDPNSEDTAVWVDGVEQLDFMAYAHDDSQDAQAFVPVIEAEQLVTALAEVADEDGGYLPPVSQAWAEHALPEAVRLTWNASRSPTTDGGAP